MEEHLLVCHMSGSPDGDGWVRGSDAFGGGEDQGEEVRTSMTQRKKPNEPSKGNIELAKRYEEAWRRINSALEHDYHFEAIAIEESILSNRITSFLHGVGAVREDEIRQPKKYLLFNTLIERWTEQCKKKGHWDNPADLIDSVDKWRQRRNSAIHALTESFPGEPPLVSLGDFLEEAKRTAKEGAKLARQVDKWHRCQLAAKKKAKKVPPPRKNP
jgi:hypothetical protein